VYKRQPKLWRLPEFFRGFETWLAPVFAPAAVEGVHAAAQEAAHENLEWLSLIHIFYDTSRCMFCGMCEDACPVDALELTQDFEMATYTREGQIWDRQMLEEGPLPTRYKC